jgi:hypothetical protein
MQPHTGMDPETAGWFRSPDDPNVQKRRAFLKEHNGIKGLQLISGEKVAAGDDDEIKKAASVFLRDGFCAVQAALNPEQLDFMRGGCDRNIAEMVSRDPTGAGRGTPPNHQPGRYSFGSGRHLHEPEWCMLVDLPTTTPILKAIFESPDYCWSPPHRTHPHTDRAFLRELTGAARRSWGAGGDFYLAGAIEYQPSHRDVGPGSFNDPAGRVTVWELPPFAVTPGLGRIVALRDCSSTHRSR